MNENNSLNFCNLPDVLTIKDLQQVLQIGLSTAYALIREDKIKCFRIGKSIKIPKPYLIDFMVQNQYNSINQ